MLLIGCWIMLGAIIFTAGACVFSFVNVVVYRVPRQMSFVKGFSACPACGHRLGGRDLIPVLSYLRLRGRCRYCRASIGVRDLLVEVFGGLTRSSAFSGSRSRERR